MTKDEIIKALRDMAKYPTVTLPKDCDTLRAAADELERMQQGIKTLHAMYEQAVKQRDYLMDQQRAQIEAMRGRVQ